MNKQTKVVYIGTSEGYSYYMGDITSALCDAVNIARNDGSVQVIFLDKSKLFDVAKRAEEVYKSLKTALRPIELEDEQLVIVERVVKCREYLSVIVESRRKEVGSKRQ